MRKKIKLLIVDDSPIKIKILEHIFSLDKEIEVIGNAKDADETLKLIRKEKPDVITMDINIQGGINGFELTKIIMSKNPIPVIVVSAIRNEKNRKDVAEAILKSGALFFIDSPPGPWNENFNSASKNLIRHVKLLSNPSILEKRKINLPRYNILPKEMKNNSKLILIGISTGGPSILKNILSKLPEGFKTPIIIAQHISVGFDILLTNQLAECSRVKIKIPENHEKIKEDCIYIAPAGKITEIINDEIVYIDPPEGYSGHLPSISALFASVVSFYGSNVLGIIMTGMGSDGVEELKMLKNSGAVTIAQDEKSSIVYGMPREAAKINAATYIMNPEMIAEYIIKYDKK